MKIKSMNQTTILDYLSNEIEIYYETLSDPSSEISIDFVIELDALEKAFTEWEDVFRFGYVINY